MKTIRLPVRRLGAVMLMSLCLAAPGRAGAATVNIGWTAWADAELVTNLARRLIEREYGHDVTMTLLDIALQYQGIARGDLDVMLMAWLPDTHADYWERYRDDVVDLGELYSGGRLGWVVPTYVPREDISTIADLRKPEVANRLHREIFGIDPGAGLMRLSEQAVTDYGLDQYTLIASSSAAMAAMVERAWQRDQWIVATAWRPHWIFHTWDLRFLADPKESLGGSEEIHALGRRGLREELPDVAGFISRMHLSLDEVEGMMARALDISTEAAIDEYVAEHPEKIHYWLTGEGEPPSE